MLTEKTQKPSPVVAVNVPSHVLALVQEARELSRLWQAAPDGSPESLGLHGQLDRTRDTMAV